MEDTKIQWHPGFVAAMNLEFAENRDDLTFEPEYNLNTKPLEIDLLIIKKEASVPIENDIGSFSGDIIYWNTSHQKIVWISMFFINRKPMPAYTNLMGKPLMQ